MRKKAPPSRQLVLAALCCSLLRQGGDALPPAVGGLGWTPRAMPGEHARKVFLVLGGRVTESEHSAGAHMPWTPRGVAQAWRVAAPQMDMGDIEQPWQWNAERHDDEPDYSAGDEESQDAFVSSDVECDTVPGPAPMSPKLTLVQSAAGMSVYSVVYAVVLAHSAAQRFARSILITVASLAGSPFRAAIAATSAAVELCWTGKAAPSTPGAELAKLSQQHRQRLFQRDGTLYEAPQHISDCTQDSDSRFTTPATSSSTR